jgi:hypothetical protein
LQRVLCSGDDPWCRNSVPMCGLGEVSNHDQAGV